jgi:hypothetical protein
MRNACSAIHPPRWASRHRARKMPDRAMSAAQGDTLAPWVLRAVMMPGRHAAGQTPGHPSARGTRPPIPASRGIPEAPTRTGRLPTRSHRYPGSSSPPEPCPPGPGRPGHCRREAGAHRAEPARRLPSRHLPRRRRCRPGLGRFPPGAPARPRPCRPVAAIRPPGARHRRCRPGAGTPALAPGHPQPRRTGGREAAPGPSQPRRTGGQEAAPGHPRRCRLLARPVPSR